MSNIMSIFGMSNRMDAGERRIWDAIVSMNERILINDRMITRELSNQAKRISMVELKLSEKPEIEKVIVRTDTGISSSLERQEGGSHYKDCAIQPLAYIEANNLSFPEGNIIKYVTRRKGDRLKGDRLKDLKKARHYLDYLIELEEKFLSWNKNEET